MSFEPRPAESPVENRKSRVEARDLEEQRAGALVPVEREVAVDFTKAGDAVFY